LNKQAIKNALKQLLEEHAQKGLTTAEHDAIKKKLLHAQELKQLIQDYQAKSITSNIDEYKQRFITFIDSLLAMHHGERYNLSIIYLYYLNNTVTYIFDILNTKELKNHKHHIKKINKILTTIVLEIEESYEKRIATFSGEENT
jgi:hypothetical protein